MNYQELHETVKNGSIIGAVDTNGKKDRFFISDNGCLCRFKPRSRRGYCVCESDLARYTQFIPSKPPPTGEEKLRKEYRLIEKYKRMAAQASFTNPFIRDCLALPDFDVWRKDLVEPNSWEKDKEPSSEDPVRVAHNDRNQYRWQGDLAEPDRKKVSA